MPAGPLTPADLDFFRANGYLHLKGFLTEAEIEPLRQDSARLIERGIDTRIDDPTYCYGQDAQDADRQCLFRINDLIKTHDLDSVRLLLGHPRLLGAVHQATGGDYFAAQVHSLVFKIPHRGYPVPWHQDPVKVYRWPVFNMDIYLDEANPHNGGLHVIPHSHLGGYYGTPEFVRAWTQGKEADAPGAVAVHTKPGDVLFHSTSVLHGSFWNRSESLRRTLYLHFNHYQDVIMRPEDDGHRTEYLRAQQITAEAIERRRQLRPDEQPFDYRLVSEAMMGLAAAR